VKNTPSFCDDGRIVSGDERLTIRWSYSWGTKGIRFRATQTAKAYPLSKLGRKWGI